MTSTLLLASANPGKIREFAELLATVRVLGLRDLGIGELEEPYDDFVKNAEAKAREASRISGLPALADDSGLCVDALNGAPGVFSARYAGGHGDDEANRARLLREMKHVPEGRRGARFWCVLCLADVHGALGSRVLWVAGDCPGTITRAARGALGFGYDSLVVPEGCNPEGRTLAELTPSEKHALSHRGRAVEAMLPLVREYLARRLKLALPGQTVVGSEAL